MYGKPEINLLHSLT